MGPQQFLMCCLTFYFASCPLPRKGAHEPAKPKSQHHLLALQASCCVCTPSAEGPACLSLPMASLCLWVPHFCPPLKGDTTFAQAPLYLLPSLGSHTLMTPRTGPRPLKPSPEPLTQVSLPRGHPVCHIPYLLLSSVPHLLGVAPVSQGPRASCLAAFFIPPHICSQSPPEQSRPDSLCPSSPLPGSRLRPPASLIWTLSLLPGLPASRLSPHHPPHEGAEPRTDLLRPSWPPPTVLDKVQPSAPPWRP